MSFAEDLRNFVSVQGVPQNSSQAVLQETLVKALELNPPAKQEAEIIAKRQANGSVDKAGNRQNVFVTQASLATFPVASVVIASLWKLLQVLLPNTLALKSPFVPFVIAVLLGAYLVYMDLSDPERIKPPTSREKLKKSVIGLINSLILVAAVLGIDTFVLHL